MLHGIYFGGRGIRYNIIATPLRSVPSNYLAIFYSVVKITKPPRRQREGNHPFW
jgi:hypothetical protein